MADRRVTDTLVAPADTAGSVLEHALTSRLVIARPRTSSRVPSTRCRGTRDPYLAPGRRRIVRGAGAAPDPGWPADLACAGRRV